MNTSTIVLACFVVAFSTVIVKAWQARRYMRRLQRMGLPMPPHNILLGHLGLVASISKSLPHDAHGNYLPEQIRKRYPDLGPSFYLDLWPFSDPMLIVNDPEMIAQFNLPDRMLPKHPGVIRFIHPITGGYDLNCLEGEQWKFWRRLFNPGFAAGHILSLVPSIVEETLIFRDHLVRHAKKGDMFLFEEHALNLAIDVIGTVALDTKLSTQHRPNPMTSALLDQRRWAVFGFETDFLTIMNPMRYFHIWNNRRIMDSYMNKELDNRYSAIQSVTKSKTIIDLALNAYRAEGSLGNQSRKNELDATFRKYALSQMKLFIFAGHDTTATTICYVWLLLSRNHLALSKLRAEHDDILGPNKSNATNVLSNNPALLNNLPYTLAVIKETLRLFPVVSSPRKGQENFILTDSSHRSFPTENCLVWAVHHGIHHNPAYWNRVDEFLPERFLTDSERDEDLRPIKNVWRPFEFGPRACIGSELALAELKVMLALTAREFDIQEAYAEWDELHGTKGIKTVDGERVYQIQLGSAHPADGFPARVRMCGGSA